MPVPKPVPVPRPWKETIPGLPLAVPVGRKAHFNFPVMVSTPNRPPRFDEFPPTIVVPELDGDVHDVEGLALVRGHLFG